MKVQEKMKVARGYKGFNKDMTCRGFQFEVGGTYRHEGEIALCGGGFHFCLNPLDILDFYSLNESVFCLVEASGNIITAEDQRKSVADEIHVIRKLELREFIEAAVECLSEEKTPGYSFGQASVGDRSCHASTGACTHHASTGYRSNHASTGDDSRHASTGYDSHHASTGDDSRHASTGDDSRHASTGYDSRHASTGYRSNHASTGDDSRHASTGDRSCHASAGDDSRHASTGYRSNHASTGDDSRHASTGDRSCHASAGDDSRHASTGDRSCHASAGRGCIISATGAGSVIKAAAGSWITLAEYGDDDRIKLVKSACIDGVCLKADTFYKLENGEFVEAE